VHPFLYEKNYTKYNQPLILSAIYVPEIMDVPFCGCSRKLSKYKAKLENSQLQNYPKISLTLLNILSNIKAQFCK